MTNSLRRFWYNYVSRHFWYHYFNWRYPNLPRVRAGKITPEIEAWAEKELNKNAAR